MTSPFDLTGRTAVVTGASRGIGLGIATGLVEAGADVVGLQRSPFSELFVQRCADLGRTVTHVPVDLGSESSIAAAVQQTLALGEVDILVNNAGNQIRHDSVAFPLADFDAVLDVHLRAVFQLCQGFGAPMLERGWGRIVNLGSVLTFQGGLRVPAYAAAKGAIALTQTPRPVAGARRQTWPARRSSSAPTPPPTSTARSSRSTVVGSPAEPQNAHSSRHSLVVRRSCRTFGRRVIASG